MKKPEQQFAWLHMVVIAVVFTFLVFAAISLNGPTQFWTFYIGWCLIVPAILLFACWAALGMGATWLRVFVFSSFGPVLFMAAIGGFFIGTIWNGIGLIGMYSMSAMNLAGVAALLSFGCCVACQVPFWALRAVFGWQLVQTNRDWSQKKISIKDMLLLTALFALAFALPQFGTDIYFGASVETIQVGSQFVEPGEIDANGVATSEPVIVTESNIELIKDNQRKLQEPMRNAVSLAVLVYSAIVAVLALLFAPAVVLSLRVSGTSKGVMFAAIYLFALCLVIEVLVLIFSIGPLVWWQAIPYIIGISILVVAAAMIPLAVSRSRGIRLANNRDFSERRIRVSAEESTTQSAVLH